MQKQPNDNINYPNYQMPQSCNTPINQTVSVKTPQPYVPPGQSSNLVQQDAQNATRPEFRSVAPPQSPMGLVQNRPVESSQIAETMNSLKLGEDSLQQASEPVEVNKQTTTNQSVPWRVQRPSQQTTENVSSRNNTQEVYKQTEQPQKRQSQIETKSQEVINQSPKPVRKELK